METKQVLVIDDEPSIRKLVQIWLRAIAGWEVLTAALGQEGLAIAETEQPDAILLDVIMPEMNGILTFQRMRPFPLFNTFPRFCSLPKSSLVNICHIVGANGRLPLQKIVVHPSETRCKRNSTLLFRENY
jgi:CheY-like chemotaxis protein